MYDKKLQTITHDQDDAVIGKEERYELIAQIAQRVNELKEVPDVEEQQLWDTNDTSINFDDLISHYN